MYTYLLFLIYALSTIVECQGIWNSLMDLMSSSILGVPEDAELSIAQLAKKYGYDIQRHTVTTEDGYILNIHRMPHGKKKANGISVFLMHGLMESSDCWVLQGPRYSLAYMLADAGFDVWMGNARGNKHSMKHTTLESTQSVYWNFTWDEIGVRDLPAMIDYILNKTNSISLYYVGHSQGTTCGYVLLSMKPTYNKKIKIMFSLAPEAFMSNIESPIIKLFSYTVNHFSSYLQNFNPLAAGTETVNKVLPILCGFWSWNCDNIIYIMLRNGSKINESLVPVIFGHAPTGSSTLQLLHYGQLLNSARFCRYDYGFEQNIKVYNQISPPDYDLSKIVAPMVLFYSSKDWLSAIADVLTLEARLPNVIDAIHLKDYNHLDYMYAAEAFEDIYIFIVKKINKFERFNDKVNDDMYESPHHEPSASN